MTYQIVYSSEAVAPMQTGDLEKLLDHARLSNAANGITGALVYAEGSFLQILEGDNARVQQLMSKIQRDGRHEAVFILREGEVPEAIFGSWKMAFVSATPQQVARWAGVSVEDGSIEASSDAAEEERRTAQFAQDILALLVADDAAEGKAD